MKPKFEFLDKLIPKLNFIYRAEIYMLYASLAPLVKKSFEDDRTLFDKKILNSNHG